MCIFLNIILDFKLFEPMISLQKEKEKDDKQLEEVSWHRFVLVHFVLSHSLVRGLIIFAEKLIFYHPYLNFFCVFVQAQRKISQQQTEIDVSSSMYPPFCVKC